ncbi:MAG: Rv2578c family radical SAM protein [Acidothermus sp.]|nr:Rv2578c family radical SAM protein [Acidothermus sp.]
MCSNSRVRWDGLRSGEEPSLFDVRLLGAPGRVVSSPQFAGITFYEIFARSILNRVPDSSRVPFRWTINPYRGCSHACRYCFARNTHTYLDLDAGSDFDSKIVVKVNAVEVLRRELARPSWRREHVAMGTNVDCYQRAEGRYRLMPGIIEALADYRTPFSILTKGSLVLRDLAALQHAARRVDVSTAVSVGFVDTELWRHVEPGTPSPLVRLEVCRALNEAGIRCGVLLAPILPGLTDDDEHLAATIDAIRKTGATHVTPIVLHLRPGAREWYLAWLERHRPDLLGLYRRLYSRSAYAPPDYQRAVCAKVHELALRAGIGASEEARNSARWEHPRRQAS